MAIAPETACRLMGSMSLAICRVINMNNAKSTATPRGRRAGQPTSAKLGWMTSSVPMNPTMQATMRLEPTSSPRIKWPNINMMNGMTNAIATAFAKGK